LPAHAAYKSRSLDGVLFDQVIDNELVGVTGALMFQLKSTWQTVVGFSLSLPLSYNYVDYRQKIRSFGFGIVQANSVTAIHNESVTRKSIAEDWQKNLTRLRWSEMMSLDEFSVPYK
jgi:GT2 family glycosyltransferase